MSMEPRSTNPNSKIDKRLEGWAERSRHQHLRLFSELDVLLRALDRFFSPEGAEPSAAAPSGRNYLRELNAAKDVIFRVLAILDAVIPQGSKNAYQFMKFTESSISSPQRRDALRGAFYKQDTMEQGLFLLYDSFANINGVIMDMLKAKQIPNTSFVNLGELITREIRENVYFNPFRAEIDPELDRVDNNEISAIVRSIGDRRLRNTVSLIFVYLFRILRFLGHTNERLPQRTVSLHVSILILMMLRSELLHFLSYTENASAAGPELAEVLGSVHYQYTMELRRVYRAEMKGVFSHRSLHQIRSRVENSAGILRNLTEQCLIQVAQIWRPTLKGEDIFDDFVTKTEQSTRLREDLYVLQARRTWGLRG